MREIDDDADADEAARTSTRDAGAEGYEEEKAMDEAEEDQGGEGRTDEDNEVEGHGDECTDYRRPRLKTERQDEDEEWETE